MLLTQLAVLRGMISVVTLRDSVNSSSSNIPDHTPQDCKAV